MARAAKSKSQSKKGTARKKPAGKGRAQRGPLRRLVRRTGVWVFRGFAAVVALIVVLVLVYTVVNPPVTHTIWSEWRRLGKVERDWTRIEDIAPVMARSVVAAEDADFCLHWGFDVAAIRAAMDDGARRGGSTISQQVAKNVFLWQGRSWVRKALEAAITPVIEMVWSKRRILEVYLNVAEMDEGVFGVAAASRGYFGVEPDKLSPQQAARLATVLPSPRTRSAAKPTPAQRRRAAAIQDGAATIGADGRAACFE